MDIEKVKETNEINHNAQDIIRNEQGTFKTELDAAIAYNNKATELYGEFAKLNIFEDDVNDALANLNNR